MATLGKASNAASEEALDPSDWCDVQALSHQIIDDAVGYLRDVRDGAGLAGSAGGNEAVFRHARAGPGGRISTCWCGRDRQARAEIAETYAAVRRSAR